MSSITAFYYKGIRNFGDELNSVILPRLFPDVCLEDSGKPFSSVLLGIGTILNSQNAKKLSRYRVKYVFSSGYGYDQDRPPLLLTDDWQISCVRGPHTAAAMRLPNSLAVTDGAALIARFMPPRFADKPNGPAFIPHVTTALQCGELLEETCDAVGLKYIDPRSGIDDIVQHLATSSFVLTEALHAAIVSDAYRTPWVAVRLGVGFPFKWNDWCASLNMNYEPVDLPSLWPQMAKSRISRLRLEVKRCILERRLSALLPNPPLRLSRESVLRARISELEERAAILARQFSAE
jgi:succinoglycan biosynthesis protein ExoV